MTMFHKINRQDALRGQVDLNTRGSNTRFCNNLSEGTYFSEYFQDIRFNQEKTKLFLCCTYSAICVWKRSGYQQTLTEVRENIIHRIKIISCTLAGSQSSKNSLFICNHHIIVDISFATEGKAMECTQNTWLRHFGAANTKMLFVARPKVSPGM